MNIGDTLKNLYNASLVLWDVVSQEPVMWVGWMTGGARILNKSKREFQVPGGLFTFC